MSKRFSFLILGLAVLVGVLYLAPQLLIKRAVENSGRTFVLAQFNQLHDGGEVYFQFAREAAEGHIPPADLYFDQQLPNIYPPLPPVILSVLIRIFGDVTGAYLAALFIFPAITFLFFFWLGWIVFDRNKLWSVFMALTGILTPIFLVTSQIFLGPSYFANIVLKNFYPGIQTLLPLLFFSRVDHPLITSLIYLPAIASLLIFWKRPSAKTAVLTGFVSGLLFYTYFHFWAYWVVVGGLLLVASLLLWRHEKALIKNFLGLIGVFIVISIPYVVNQFRLSRLPGYDEFIKRVGVDFGHGVGWQWWPYYLIYAGMAILIYAVLWKKENEKKRAVFYWVALLSGVVALNVQVITGFVPHPDHWSRAVDPILALMIFEIIYHLAKRASARYPNFKKALPIALALLMVLLVAKKAVNVAGFVRPDPESLVQYAMPEDLLESWRWMDENLKEPKIISPSIITTIYSTAFSSARPFLPSGGVIPITNEKLEDLFLIANKVFGVSVDVVEKRLRGGVGLDCKYLCDWNPALVNIEGASGFLYSSYFKHLTGSKAVPEEKIAELSRKYRKIRADWDNLGANYVYYGPLERQFSTIDPKKDSRLELVYKNTSVEIYKIKR
ncbi:MAG: hypothetical protein Q7S83_03575 [bacterium]|nr:hypothetical protein [bacterium]